jgi:hypothetical protein
MCQEGLQALLCILPYTVVCRATRFGGNVQLTALRRDGISSGNCQILGRDLYQLNETGHNVTAVRVHLHSSLWMIH